MNEPEFAGMSMKVALANTVALISDKTKNIKILKNRASLETSVVELLDKFPGYTVEKDGLLLAKQ